MSSYIYIEPRSFEKLERYFRVGYRLLCWSLGLLYLYGLMYVAFLPEQGSPEDSKSAWCEEYHPNLTYSECAKVAGW